MTYNTATATVCSQCLPVAAKVQAQAEACPSSHRNVTMPLTSSIARTVPYLKPRGRSSAIPASSSRSFFSIPTSTARHTNELMPDLSSIAITWQATYQLTSISLSLSSNFVLSNLLSTSPISSSASPFVRISLAGTRPLRTRLRRAAALSSRSCTAAAWQNLLTWTACLKDCAVTACMFIARSNPLAIS
jgi:hypothetical protein